MKNILEKLPKLPVLTGWAAPSNDPLVVMGLMQDVIDSCGYHDKVAFALDCALSEMYDSGTNTYLFKSERGNGRHNNCLYKKN